MNGEKTMSKQFGSNRNNQVKLAIDIGTSLKNYQPKMVSSHNKKKSRQVNGSQAFRETTPKSRRKQQQKLNYRYARYKANKAINLGLTSDGLTQEDITI